MHFSLFQNQEKKIVMDLFEKVFKKKINEEFWKWRYAAFGKPIAGLLWDEKKLVGHYMLSPIPMKIDDHMENALLAMSVMIDPDYHGKGIYFGPLAKFTYDAAINEGYNMIFAFPNEKSYKIHFGPLGWNDFGRIREYKKQIISKNIPGGSEITGNRKLKAWVLLTGPNIFLLTENCGWRFLCLTDSQLFFPCWMLSG